MGDLFLHSKRTIANHYFHCYLCCLNGFITICASWWWVVSAGRWTGLPFVPACRINASLTNSVLATLTTLMIRRISRLHQSLYENFVLHKHALLHMHLYAHCLLTLPMSPLNNIRYTNAQHITSMTKFLSSVLWEILSQKINLQNTIGY